MHLHKSPQHILNNDIQDYSPGLFTCKERGAKEAGRERKTYRRHSGLWLGRQPRHLYIFRFLWWF